MLVKITGKGRTLKGATQRLDRALREFRVRGVKTNIPFLINVVNHPDFRSGQATVKFIETHPELVKARQGLDRGTKTLRYLGKILVNGNQDVKAIDPKKRFREPVIPSFDRGAPVPKGSRDRLKELGREAFLAEIKADPLIHYTDTTFRDAHQSLLATRMRTIDMFNVAESFAHAHPEIFSMEVWGGATFDVCLRFLKEDPWKRLELLREKIPNILFQMLLRGSNAVGYKAYPDNLVQEFIVKAADTGIDIFRIFDSLNWLEAMKVSIRTVRERTESLAEACICYTGDITDLSPNNKYNLQYYLDMARQLEDEGAHILAIKDMAGLLKPMAATTLITELKKAVDLPIHLHTHDTSSNQTTTYLKAVEAGVDIMDVAISSMSGLTSQPNFNSFVALMEGQKRARPIDLPKLNQFANYWEIMREYYYPFESELRSGTSEVYQHEIPGGQYSNLLPQARSLGLEEKFEQIKTNYAIVNRMFGQIVKVTPSSKVVGDMALFMTSNDLSEQDVMERGETLSFPDSVKSFFRGDLGQPHGGFPQKLQKIVLKDEKPYTDRPNAHLEPIEMDQAYQEFQAKFPHRNMRFLDFISYQLYPKVFEDYYQHLDTFDEVMKLPTNAFFYAMKRGEEILVKIDPGKKLLIEYMYMLEPDEDGLRKVFFRLNGQTRSIMVRDETVQVQKIAHRKAAAAHEVGSPLQGRLTKIYVEAGAKVTKNQPLFVIEAMKMESTISANQAGAIAEVALKEGVMVEQDDLVVAFTQS